MKQRRNFGICLHRSTITTITAGLAREVCETCSHVRVWYVESAVKMRPDRGLRELDPDSFAREPLAEDPEETPVFEAMVTFPESTQLRCGVCQRPARFMIPDGLGCDEHAWQAAARLDWEAADPWVPIRIYRSNA